MVIHHCYWHCPRWFPPMWCFIEDDSEWLKDSGEWELRGTIVYRGRCTRMSGSGVRRFIVGKTDGTACVEGYGSCSFGNSG